ncbi:MAG: RNA pseudouridine synthase [Pseudomonadota bacterium]|nr:RNA pseudouridine synthase [Pseudomonadota bacterium]
MTEQDVISRVLYRDGLMIVLDKPAGIPVHAGPGKGPNLEQYFDALRFGFPRPPGLAHRLDRDTTGCLVLGRHPKALRRLGKLFMDGKVEKTYWAVVRGRPSQDEGRMDFPLLRVRQKDGWRILVDGKGQESVTDYRVFGCSPDGALTWLELYPRTGRTHQIRVHCTHVGLPIVGEPFYCSPEIRGSRPGREGIPLHLHSRAITLPLYPNRDAVTVSADPPAHMLAALKACGYRIPEQAA